MKVKGESKEERSNSAEGGIEPHLIETSLGGTALTVI